MAEDIQPIGQITHYFDNIQVAAIHLWEELHVGDWVQIYGDNTNFVQEITSMELEREQIDVGFPEQEIAIKVSEPAKEGDFVYFYTE